MWEKHLEKHPAGLLTGRQPFDPARPSLLLVHGSGGSAEAFLPQLSGLSGEVNLAAIDLPGHRQSPGPGCDSVEDYAAWLGDFIAAGPLRPVILGHSLGGAVCQMLALTRPHLIRGLVLASSGCRLKVAPAILEGLAGPDASATLRLIVQFAHAPGCDARTLELGVQQLSVTPTEVILGDFKACDAFNVCQRLGEINLPVWCLVGDQDKLTPLKYSQHIVENLPGAGLTIIEGAGHTAHLERPAAFNEALLDFMGRF